jgi:hypothetical protein
MKKVRTVCFLAVLLLINSCSSITRITSTWKAENITPKEYNKVMVLGIIREADRNVRIQMESHLVQDLKDLGYNAFSAYDQYGPKMFQNMSEEQANKKLAKDDVDAVLTIVLLDKQKERYYVPRTVIYSPYVTYHNRMWGYYSSLQNRIEEPEYYQVTTKYFWESNFYDLSQGKLLFSVQTQSFEPSSAGDLAHEYGQKIVQSMVKNDILQKQQPKLIKAM